MTEMEFVSELESIIRMMEFVSELESIIRMTMIDEVGLNFCMNDEECTYSCHSSESVVALIVILEDDSQ